MIYGKIWNANLKQPVAKNRKVEVDDLEISLIYTEKG